MVGVRNRQETSMDGVEGPRGWGGELSSEASGKQGVEGLTGHGQGIYLLLGVL